MATNGLLGGLLRLVVADASSLVEYLLGTQASEHVKVVLRDLDADLHVPALCDVEVAAALRRGIAEKLFLSARAQEALEDYLDLPLTRHGHQSLLQKILELRSNFSAYDAACAALAENLKAELLTADNPLR
ncbi:MAG: type II toxin-antitoxin system VapC family toxin [Actinomycetota bacterium]